jgi:leader peptidase (prepilin peptidase)/N-methyltransferase
VTVLGAVVGRTLPSVREAQPRLPAFGYQLLTIVGAALVVATLGVFGLTLQGLASAIFCAALVVVTAADLAYRLIPNRVVLPSTVAVLALMTAADPRPEWALAALAAGGVMFAIAFAYPAGMGMGDVKLALLMGAALGRAVAPSIMLAFLLAAIPSIVLLVRHGRAGGKMGLPFGPFLAAGSLVVLFAGA